MPCRAHDVASCLLKGGPEVLLLLLFPLLFSTVKVESGLGCHCPASFVRPGFILPEAYELLLHLLARYRQLRLVR